MLINHSEAYLFLVMLDNAASFMKIKFSSPIALYLLFILKLVGKCDKNPSLCIIDFEEFTEFSEFIDSASLSGKNSNDTACKPVEWCDTFVSTRYTSGN